MKKSLKLAVCAATILSASIFSISASANLDSCASLGRTNQVTDCTADDVIPMCNTSYMVTMGSTGATLCRAGTKRNPNPSLPPIATCSKGTTQCKPPRNAAP